MHTVNRCVQLGPAELAAKNGAIAMKHSHSRQHDTGYEPVGAVTAAGGTRLQCGCAVLLAALAASGCGGLDQTRVGGLETSVAGAEPGASEAPPSVPQAENEASPPAPVAQPLYAVSSVVFSPEATTTYVSFVEDLDEDIDLSRALEFPGWALINEFDGDLFVTDSESYAVTRFGVALDGGTPQLEEKGAISLGAYAFAPEFVIPTGDSSKAYLSSDGNPLHVLLDPDRMALGAEFELPGLARDNFRLRSSRPLFTDRGLLRTFYFEHDVDPRVSDDTELVWINPAADVATSRVPDAGCSVLNKLSSDESGNIYLSTWLYGPTLHLMAQGLPTCARRIRAGETSLDPSWSLDYAALTGGRQGGELSYVSDGKAILSVFHDERLSVADKDGDPWSLAGTPNWRVWSVDLESRTAQPLEDIEWSAGDHVTLTSDGRFFVLIPGANWETTTIYEVLDGATRAETRGQSQGWINRVVRLR